MVQQALGDAGRLGEIFDGGAVEAVRREHLERRVEELDPTLFGLLPARSACKKFSIVWRSSPAVRRLKS